MNTSENKHLTIGEMLRILKKAFQISISVRFGVSILVSLIGFPMALLPAVISLLLKRFADNAQNLYLHGIEEVRPIIFTFFLLSLAYLFQTFFRVLQIYYSEKDALDIEEYIRETILRCACRVQYKYIDNEDDFLNKMAFAKTESGQRVANSIGSLIGWLQNLLAFCSMLYLLMEVDGWIVLALLVTSLPAILLANFQKDEEYRRKTKWMKEGALVIHQFHDCCAQYSLNEVRFLGLFDALKEKWKNSAKQYISVKNKMTRKHVLYNLAADFLRSCVFLVILYLTAKKIFENPEIGIGIFLLVLNTAGDFQKTATKLFVTMVQFAGDIRYMKDFFDMEEAKTETREQEVPLENTEICFHHVTFTYPSKELPVLRDLSVCIRSGEKVAIVGENGSGKTTFINLLLGLYAPDSGSITVGNRSVTEYLHSCRKNIAAIFQNFAKYEATIRQNIIISDPEKEIQDDQLYTLMKKTGADSLVRNQPNGLDEMVGSLSEKGNNLSGGQWQRIAITRAAYRENAGILVLDEPTAALDPVAEAELYRKFSEVAGEKTTLFVSHRLGITKIVDRILVFSDGRIIEDGNHKELMNKNGYYAQMYRAQAQWYN